MKPYKILLFIVSIFIILGILSIVIPQKGIVISKNLTLRFFSYHDLFSHNKVQYADISKILKESQILNDTVDHLISASSLSQNENYQNTDTTLVKKKTRRKHQLKTATEKIIPDSLKVLKREKKTINISAKSEFNLDSLKLTVHKIEYPKNNEKVLYPFFKEITYTNGTSNPVRILHYGDSQIEGDRISSILRNRLQFYFGGSGVGLIPAVTDNFNSMSVSFSSSGNWTIYKSFGPKLNSPGHKRFGALLNFAKFSLTNSTDTNTIQGWITLKKSIYSYESVKKYKQCRLFCGYNKKPVKVELFCKNKLIQSEYLQANSQLQILKFKFTDAPGEITIKFKGLDSPDIYGLALDDLEGIAVDNIPLRGSSGLEFTKTDLTFLKSMYSQLNVKMLILQFGVNVVPSVFNDYTFYENAFFNQLSTLKKLCPDISIIVIGVSDMSKKENGAFVSYPNIELIRNAQKNAAFKAGCAFWDIYKAMGGKNSMPSWVYAKPALARTDFTHFTPIGAKLVADMFYNALVLEYIEYMKKGIGGNQASNTIK